MVLTHGGPYVSPSDLSNFCKSYDSGADCKIEKFIGQNTGSRPGVESMLDTEYIEGLGQGVDTWVYSYSSFFESGLSGEEQATTQFGSGGGFSYDYKIPSYQADAVKAYLAQSPLIGSKSYAANGRATPDVALLGEKFAVEDGGRVMAVGGTSASTPSWGAVISLLNEECLTAPGGQKTLGFVNPLLYKNADAFNDITKGNNAVGENAGNGWSCTTGWDAATGLGTPNFPKLQAAVKSACGSTGSVVV